MNAVERGQERARADGVVGVVLNPVAGGGRASRLLPRVVAALRQMGCAHHVHVTGSPNEATTVARRFATDGAAMIVAVGGDGTLNEVANGLLTSGTAGSVSLAVIPAGRGADFARSIGTPKDVAEALRRAIQARPVPIDVGRATFADGSSRWFVNVAGLGFDAAVATRAARSRLPGSTIPYLSALASTLVGFRNVPVTIEADGSRRNDRVCFLVVANGRFFGGGMKIVPNADLTDGLLDLAVIGDVSKIDLIRNVPRVYRGTHVTHPKFSHAHVQTVRVDAVAPTRVQLDGEVVGATPVTFTVEPGALRFVG